MAGTNRGSRYSVPMVRAILDLTNRRYSASRYATTMAMTTVMMTTNSVYRIFRICMGSVKKYR